MSFTVAIVGRPNVGKSTLFNRLVGRRQAIVDDTPGVTRDRRDGEGGIGGLQFTVFDTAGLEDAADATLEGRAARHTADAVAASDVVLFVIDGRAGVTPIDRHFAAWLRDRDKPVILIVNKCDGAAAQSGVLDAFGLGMGDPIAISAEHGLGIADLIDALVPFDRSEEADSADLDEVERTGPLQLAIAGRPNVGKSTLINRLIGEERLLTGPESGITRDAIAIDWQWQDRAIRLFDTAGMRRKARVSERLEQMSVDDTLRAVQFAEVVVLVLDARTMLERQDLTIARLVADEGRALVLALNKWDLVTDANAALAALRDRMKTSLPQVKDVPAVPVSALTGRGLDHLMAAVFEIHETWNRRVPTAALNRWLEAMVETHPPPLAAGRPIRLRYMTQVKARPPTFAVFANKPGELPDSYLRYLTNALRADFDLKGVPIRIALRKGKNPYT
ncbi:MAG: ribosome biogenesis GTPase Der [Alphaproteobacteria bacterium]|nr:ribosome biogenesis GTPase Der [Alphaproteobacteria bacterium]